jgi:translation initiation factor 1
MSGSSERGRIVYSTAGPVCATCGWPEGNCRCAKVAPGAAAAKTSGPARVVARLRVEKSGRNGKTVTVVYGIEQSAVWLRDLSQELKRACGTGGTATPDGVELQGDLRERVRNFLEKKGFVVKG